MKDKRMIAVYASIVLTGVLLLLPINSTASETSISLPANYHTWQSMNVNAGDGLAVWWNTQSYTIDVKVKDDLGITYHQTTASGSGGFLFIAPRTAQYTVDFSNTYLFTTVTFTYSIDIVQLLSINTEQNNEINNLDFTNDLQNNTLNGLGFTISQLNNNIALTDSAQNDSIFQLRVVDADQNQSVSSLIFAVEKDFSHQDDVNDAQNSSLISQVRTFSNWMNDTLAQINRTNQDLHMKDSSLNDNINSTNNQLATTKNDLNTQIQNAKNMAYAGIGIGIVGIFIGLIGIIIARRRMSSIPIQSESVYTQQPIPYQSIPPPIPPVQPTPPAPQPIASQPSVSQPIMRSIPPPDQPEVIQKPMKRFCAKCGSPIPDAAKFCVACGAPYVPPPK